MKIISETNTYKDGVRLATVVMEYTEEEDRRAMSQVQNMIAYQRDRKKAVGDEAEREKIGEKISSLKSEERRLLAALAGYPDD